MQKYGKDVDSIGYWSDEARRYADALQNNYHSHRLAMIDRLTPAGLKAPGKRIYDFGCGDAVLFEPYLRAGAAIEGVDIAPEMIELGRQRLAAQGFDPNLIAVGGVDAMRRLDAEAYDAVLSFNVLAYLTDEEEATFYAQARRVLCPGGFLVVTHSNELFDLYSLNRYTADFFARHLVGGDTTRDAVASLLAAADQPQGRATFNIRENPLAYRYKLRRHGFEEVRQEFSNLHVAPPPLMPATKTFPDTLRWPEDERWKLMFICSTFGSCSQRL